MLKEIYESALYPTEIRAMLKYKLGKDKIKPIHTPLEELIHCTSDKEFCYSALNKVSRSFALVIRQLPEHLKDAVCVFYLVLRALDSVEDDMNVPDEQKNELLRTFHEKCYDPNFTLTGIGDQHDYRVLLENYGKVLNTFSTLHPDFQEVIVDICKKMGNGMADFSEKSVKTIEDYDLYCHYVAGLVGQGLSGLFAVSGIEEPSLKNEMVLSNSMGLFLQKTNIIRDYFEDIESGRMFWPNEIWQQYATNLDEFKYNPENPMSLSCLNHLVTDALRHIPDCLAYLSLLRNRKVFRFCAIPQLMAIATLSKIYNNPKVFTENVKIRKGYTLKTMMYTNTMSSVFNEFEDAARTMMKKLSIYDPNYQVTMQYIQDIFNTIESLEENNKTAPKIAKAS